MWTDKIFSLVVYTVNFVQNKYWLLAGEIIIFIIVCRAIFMSILLIRTSSISRKNMLYSRIVNGGKKILIVGDSTAVGTGADRKEDTIAGRLAHDFPRTSILNCAKNGSLTRAAISQIKATSDKFDLVIVSTGGNDVWNLTSLPHVYRDLTGAVECAKAASNGKVIVLFFGNEGSAPFFPQPIRAILNKRTEKIRKVFRKVSQEKNVLLVDLFSGDESDNPFVNDPKRFFAKDRLHPNSEGYRRWYERMWLTLTQKGYLFNDNN